MVEQITDAAADQLQRSFGQNAGFDDTAHHQLGQVGGLTRRLDDTWDPAIKVGASFSSMPQQGKLKALICTATPCSGV